MRVEEPVQEEPQAVDSGLVDHEVQPIFEIVKQPVEQHDHVSHENVNPTLRRSTRARKTTISSDYVVYLQECDYNVGAENDLETFSQAMS